MRRILLTFGLSVVVAMPMVAPVIALQDDQQSEYSKRLRALNWQQGPGTGDLGGLATVGIPGGYAFLDKSDAGKFMEINHNPPSGQELGVLLPADGSFFVVFEFSSSGYVKDEDRDLDSEALLKSIREGTEEANKIRKERGWSTMEVLGWQQQPFYDAQTNNLTWAIRGQSSRAISINHSTRLLGRRGVMNVDMVLEPELIGNAMPAFNSLVKGFAFSPGHRYAEFTKGDKVAEYGLTGLIVGGAGVALVKTGILQKFWKVIAIGFLALLGAIRKLFARFGRRESNPADHSNV